MLIGYYNHFANPEGSWHSHFGAPPTLDADNLKRLLSPHVSEPGIATLSGDIYRIRRKFSTTAVPVQIVAVLGHTIVPETSAVNISLLNGDTEVWSEPMFAVEPNIVGFENDIIFVLPAPVMATDLVFISGDSWEGAPAVGTFFVSPIYRPPEGAKNDWEIYPKDMSQSRVTPSGSAYDSVRQIVRVMESPGIDMMEQDWVFGSATYTLPDLQQVAHITGQTGRVLAIMREFDGDGNLDPHMIRRTGLYGQITSGIRIIHKASGYFGTQRIVIEQRF